MTDDILKRAYEKLDNNDFAGARDDYRQAAMDDSLSIDGSNLLLHLAEAERYGNLVFFKKVREVHPDSFGAWVREGIALEESGHIDWAIQHYTEMLIRFSDIKRQHHDTRMRRLSVACRGNKIEIIVEDINGLWLGDGDDLAQGIRPLIISLLNRELNDVRSLPILESLCENQKVPSVVQQLFRIKLTQLVEIAKLKAQYQRF